MAYSGSVELISGIVQKNNGTFPLVDASAVRVTDETRLSEELENIKSSAASGDIILVQDEQPASQNNKLWIDSDSDNEVTVPTYTEFSGLKSAIDTLEDTENDYTVTGSFANLIYETLGLYIDENGDICQKEDT